MLVWIGGKYSSFRGKLFGGTVPPNNTLFGGTVPPNSTLFGGTPDFEKPYLISMKSCFGPFNNLRSFEGKLFGPLRDDFKSPTYIH